MSFRDDVWWELRYALRSFRTAPSFIALIVLTLVLGVSANGAVYTLIDRLFVGTPKGVSGAEVIKRVHQRFTPPLSRRPE